jgi:hypothetical protein
MEEMGRENSNIDSGMVEIRVMGDCLLSSSERERGLTERERERERESALLQVQNPDEKKV